MPTIWPGCSGGSTDLGTHRPGSRTPAPQAPQARGPFIAEVRIITSGKRTEDTCRFRRPGPDGVARVRANLVWAGQVLTAGGMRGELDSMVAGWGCGGTAHL